LTAQYIASGSLDAELRRVYDFLYSFENIDLYPFGNIDDAAGRSATRKTRFGSPLELSRVGELLQGAGKVGSTARMGRDRDGHFSFACA
jgi:hypothetical protein